MSLIDYTMDEHVAIVSMNAGENRFNFDFFNAFHEVLDAVEKEANASVLVVKSSDEKIWSNGIDLEWIGPLVQKEGPEIAKKFNLEIYRLFKRIMVFPMTTIAALTGHAFAGGGIMSCAFDFRFMRSDRGWLCFPEIDINIPFTNFLNEIVKTAIPMYKIVEMQVTGQRLTADECVEHHIVIKACPKEELMNEVLAFAKTQNKGREVMTTMKTRLFADALRVYEESQSPSAPSLL
jgi:Delta3-Delta2-enoyl-CoA isomerase